MEEMEKKWYVLHTLSGHEGKVKRTIEHHTQTSDIKDMIGRVLVPTETVSEVKGGKKSITERKFFPGYVLVEMALTNDTWHFVNSFDGVIGFIGGSSTPEPLRDSEVEDILTQVDNKKEKVQPKVLFEKGEIVKVTDGPFVNFTGTIDEVNPEKGKLMVMVSIFGRATPVELEYWQVERG